MSIKEIFTCVFKYTQSVEITRIFSNSEYSNNNNNTDNFKNYNIKDSNTDKFSFLKHSSSLSSSRLTLAANFKEKILSHVCFRLSINSGVGTWGQVCW